MHFSHNQKCADREQGGMGCHSDVYETSRKLVIQHGLTRALGSLIKFQLAVHLFCWSRLVIDSFLSCDIANNLLALFNSFLC